jgi:hypothetical protein
MIGPIKLSLILLLRAIACIYPLFEQAENSGLKELALVSYAYANMLTQHSKVDASLSSVKNSKSAFSKRVMLSDTIIACPDHTIQRALYIAARLPLNSFTSASDPTSKPKKK